MDRSGTQGGWALLGEDENSINRFDLAGRLDVEDKNFSGYLEGIELRPGLTLYQGCGSVNNGFRVTASDDMDPATLSLGYQLDGRTRLETPGHCGPLYKQAGDLLVLTTAGRHATYHLAPQAHMRICALSVSPQALDELFRGRVADAPPGLRAALCGRVAPFAASGRMDAALRHAATELARPAYVGRLRHLYREAKALELLVRHLDLLCGLTPRAEGLSARDLRLVREARDRLMADLRNPPILTDLAYAVGLDPKKLNRGFRHLFGTTAFEYLREARLEAARALLRETDPPPLKEIAWRVGYAHPNHFITAYRRRFGVPPASDARLLREGN